MFLMAYYLNMMPLRLKLVSLLCISFQVTTSLTQSLLDVLSEEPELSSFNSLIQSYPNSAASLTNITLFAPDNNAVGELLNSSTGAAIVTQPDLVQAILVCANSSHYMLPLPSVSLA